jgi:hypothetical protein
VDSLCGTEKKPNREEARGFAPCFSAKELQRVKSKGFLPKKGLWILDGESWRVSSCLKARILLESRNNGKWQNRERRVFHAGEKIMYPFSYNEKRSRLEEEPPLRAIVCEIIPAFTFIVWGFPMRAIHLIEFILIRVQTWRRIGKMSP